MCRCNAEQAAGQGELSRRAQRTTIWLARVIGTVLAMTDSESLQAVTMLRLAERLGVGTTSLYRHIEDEDHLIDAGVVERPVLGAPDRSESTASSVMNSRVSL